MNLKTAVGVVAGLAVVALFFWFGLPDSGSLNTTGTASVNTSAGAAELRNTLNTPVPEDKFTEVTSGLLVATALTGQGEVIKPGQIVAVHYIGRFEDGTQFDSSVERGEPLVFEYGTGQLIPGFEQGISNMRLGEVRRIIIAPELGYGASGVTLPNGTVVIPPNATLIFDVILVDAGTP